MSKLSTDNLEYEGVDTLSYLHIVEVALRHGFDPSLKEEFTNWVQEQIVAHYEYREWEIYMGDDL